VTFDVVVAFVPPNRESHVYGLATVITVPLLSPSAS